KPSKAATHSSRSANPTGPASPGTSEARTPPLLESSPPFPARFRVEMSPEVGGVKSATGHVRMLIVAMQMSTDPAESPARRALDPVEVPLHPGVVTRMRTAIEAALDDGPALLPLPTHSSVRAALLDEFRPAEPLESDAAFVVPTSGSTGRPKGVLLSASAV